MPKLTPPLKWHGGKHYLAKDIIAMMPEHIHYVEPFFGGGSVLLQKPIGKSECVNDLHGSLTNFWEVLQDPSMFEEFRRTVEAMPFSQVEWTLSRAHVAGRVPAAVNFFVNCRQSRAGKMDGFATLSRNRIRGGMNEQASAWISAVDGLPEVHKRLRGVVILNMDAVKVIAAQDGKHTLFYLDPPYVHDTRVTTNDYDFEMSIEDHKRLLTAITKCKGKVILSGYPNELYDSYLPGWTVVDKTIDNKASSAKTKPKMVERLWLNFEPKDN